MHIDGYYRICDILLQVLSFGMFWENLEVLFKRGRSKSSKGIALMCPIPLQGFGIPPPAT